MSSVESSDEEVNFSQRDDLIQQIMRRKKAEPSHWEADEEDVDEVTEEELQNNPIKRILWAAENNHYNILEEIIDSNPNLVNCRDEDGYSPLHRAAYGNNLRCAELLVTCGADVDARTNDGWQPLHSAAMWNCVDVAELLVHNGAELNVRTNGGQTPLHLAASRQDTQDVLKLLLFDPNVDGGLVNGVGETAKEVCERSSDLHYLFELIEPSVRLLR